MEDEGYQPSISIHEIRRRAPLHFEVRADNARLAAKILSDAAAADPPSVVDEISYGGSHYVALHEAFRREASLALELILKAVTAQRLEVGISKLQNARPSVTHDLLRLWDEAEIGPLSREEHQTLFYGRQILEWAGRYPAPKRDDYFDKQADEEESLRDYVPGLSIKIFTPFGISWENFDALYLRARSAFWMLREEHLPHID